MLLRVLALTAVVAFSQNNPSTLAGKLTDPDGGAVAGVLVQAVNKSTGTMYKAQSSGAGEYTIAPLPPGEYELSVPAVGFTFDRFERKGVVVLPGQTLRVDAQLPWSTTGNLGTPGDDPSFALRNRYRSVSGPAQRTPEGRPDLSGIWNGDNDPNPEDPPVQPWAAEVVKRRENLWLGDPSAACLPFGPIPGGPLLFKFVQTPALLVEIFEGPPNVRQVFLDGRPHPQDRDPSWMGHSTGNWDGDTLVVDTVGFNDKSWLDVYPHTEMLHVVERYRRPDLGHLEVDVTYEDPGVLTKPWHQHSVWTLAPREEIFEYVCAENNKDAQHLK